MSSASFGSALARVVPLGSGMRPRRDSKAARPELPSARRMAPESLRAPASSFAHGSGPDLSLCHLPQRRSVGTPTYSSRLRAVLVPPQSPHCPARPRSADALAKRPPARAAVATGARALGRARGGFAKRSTAVAAQKRTISGSPLGWSPANNVQPSVRQPACSPWLFSVGRRLFAPGFATARQTFPPARPPTVEH